MVFWGRKNRSVAADATSAGGGSLDSSAAASAQRSTSSHFDRRLQKIVDGLNGSIFPVEERMRAINKAHQEFDHETRSKHDVELGQGAADALYAKLVFAVSTEASDKEVRLLCSALEMVHRGSPPAVEVTFKEIGFETLPILVRVLQRPYADSLSCDEIRAHGEVSAEQRTGGELASDDLKVAVQKTCKVLVTYSLVESARLEMAASLGMLSALVRVMDRSSGMAEATRHSALACLANVAQAEENHVAMALEKGLIDAIARMSSSEESDVARQCSALALMHLSYGNADSVPLADNEILLLDTFIELLRDKDPENRRNAGIALYNFACADVTAIKLVTYRRGVVLEILLRVLSNRKATDESRTLATETVFHLSKSEMQDVTERIGNHPGLLKALGNVLTLDDTPPRMQEVAADALHRMAQVTDSSRPSHKVLLTALVQGSSWTRTSKVSEAFDVQASVPGHRKILAEHKGVLDALAAQALAEEEDGDREKMREEEDEDIEKVHEAATSAIVKLNTLESNRRLMARHEGIRKALARAPVVGTNEDENSEEEEEEERYSYHYEDDGSHNNKNTERALQSLMEER